MDKQLFDQAIGEVPPSSVDVDAVIARERRAAWVRRAVNPWMATAAGVVAVSLGVAFLPHSTDGGGTTVGGQPAVTSPPAVQTTAPLPPCGPISAPATPTSTTAPPATPDPRETAEVTARLSAALAPAVRSRLANAAELVATSAAEYGGTSYGPLQPYRVYRPRPSSDGHCQAGQDYYMARTNFSRGAVIGNLLVVIESNAGLRTTCDGPGGGYSEEISCQPGVAADGSTYVASTLRLEGGAVLNRVEVTRPDGTGITLQAENVADDAKNGGQPLTPEPLLTHQQLIEIALTPGLDLTP